MNLVMLLYPNLTQLDLTGPHEVFQRFGELDIHLASKSLDPVSDPRGLKILPTCSFEAAPQADILFVPGGPGQIAVMQDEETLAFLRRQASGARYVTSVCTGSLILAAAGLLTGYRASCHWLSLQQLSLFGSMPVTERIVFDDNRITGAGVTSGIDFALALSAQLFGEERARQVQLMMEYDPAPPFAGGSPKTSPSESVAAAREIAAEFQRKREAVSRAAAARLKLN